MINMKRIRIRKSILILGIAILVIAIGFFNRKYFSHEIAKQDHMAPVYGEGSLDGWKFQFDMYTNNPGENAVDKTNSVSTIEHEFHSRDEYKYITLQTSYTYTGQGSFEPGTLKIYIPKYKIGSGNSSDYELYSATTNVAAGPVEEGYEWNYTTQTIDNNEYYVFTNNKKLAVEEGKENLEGMFQIAYAIAADKIYIRYDSTTQQEKPSYKEFNAKLVNTIDDNSLISDTKTVSLDFPKVKYTIRKTANKIKSLDGLPSGDYIWVNYQISTSKTYATKNLRGVLYHDSNNREKLLIKEVLPSDDCIILDDEMNMITSDTNEYYVKAKKMGYVMETPSWSFYIGYPTSEYEDETITNTAQFYGQYTDASKNYYYYPESAKNYTHEIEYIAENSVEVKLSDFKFEYPPGNYGFIKRASENQKIREDKSLSFQKIKDDNDIYDYYYLRPITTYTGTPLTVRIGDDREYIESADGTKKEWLSDNDYYFSYINFPVFKNGNGNPIKTYQAKLFVRYAGTNNYVLYSNNEDSNAGIFDTSARKEFTFSETNIVGWYIEIYNMKESIKDAESLSTSVNYSKEDIGNIGTKGYLYNFAYFDVYDDQGNLLNGASESSYTGTGYNDGLAQWDYETYGHYPRRDYAYARYLPSKEGYHIRKDIDNSKYQLDRWTGTVGLEAIKNYEYGYDYVGPITKIDMYDLLPAGMYLDNQEIEIVIDAYYGYYYYTLNGENFSSNDELKEFIEDHTLYEVKYNWNNTGRTWIHVHSDFTDVDFQKNNGEVWEVYEARFKVYIPYESIPEYGLSYKNYTYINLEPDGVEPTDDEWEPAHNYSKDGYKDSGYYDRDAVDINENGSTTDLLNYDYESTTLLEAYASQGALTKYVRSYKMDGNNKVYNNEWASSAITELNGHYEYKNRFYNSTESSVTNVVLYDNIESYYYDTENHNFVPVTNDNKWQGTFDGVDTSYLESKGYTVRTYYSTNEQAGPLKSGVTINDEWKLLTSLDTVNYSRVKSLAFEILNSEGQSAIIPPDTTLYVTIQMKAPNNVSAPKAYNGFWTEWNAIDTNGQILSNVDGIYGNIVDVKMATADVRIQKVDEDGNYVEGAELQILDENNNVVHSFTSGSNLIEINDILLNGKEYTLHEVSAPSGYIKSNDVKFTTDKNQTNQTITMTDSKTKITINKVDQDGNNLSGAQLQILDGQNVVEEWTSGSQAHVISGKLDIGKQYTLHEVSAPAGYTLGADQTFTLTENNKVLTMTNTYKPSGKTTIYVHKVLKGRSWEENDSFTFTLTAFEEAPMPDKTNAIITKNSQNYTDAFGEIEFTKVGTYIYLVDEDCPSDMICEDTKMITFTVTDNGDGTLAIVSDVDDNIINFENNKKFEAELEKKVMDKNDTTGVKSDWQDSADYDIGDEVPFSLHTTLPENVTSYNEYHMTFYDTMENGFSFKEITRVVINGEDMPIDNYVVIVNEHEFQVRIDFRGVIDDSTLNGAEIYIYYNLVLNEDAIIGEEGNVNKAYLEYSSNPKDKTETKRSEEDFAIVYTYKLQIDKVDEDNNALAGAQFKLEKKMANGSKFLVKKFDFNSESTFIFNGIDDGEYILTETVSPQGYNPIDPIEFIVVAEHEVLISSVDEEILTELSVESQTDIDLDPSIDGGNILINIVNKETEIKIIKQDEQGTSIQGAELQILDEYDSVIDTWTSDGSAHVVTGLTAGKTYTLHEKTPPDGYALSEDVEFTVNNEENQTVTMTDKKTKMNILKTDEDNNPLEGAVLQIKDGSTVIDSWTSTTSTHEINGVLTAGKTYTLEEVIPPDGYAKAVSKQFTVPTDGSDITVTMSDTKTKLEVTKVDNKNNNISGVVLQILDVTDNSVVQEWTTTNNPKTIEGLTAGHGYILHEVSSPDGYALSDDISFTMNTDIGTQQIVMTDESTKVYIKKVNVDGEEIEGAKLQILSGSTVVDEWTTTAGSTHEIIGVLGAEKKYTLHEVSVPKGYVTAEDKEFTVPKGNETLEVEMLDNKTKVSLIKLDMKSRRPLAGSHLQVIDKDNTILFEFVSTEEKVVLEGLLEVGEKYRLHEAGAPNLYQRNVDVEFTVGDTDEEIEVEISDDKTLLSIEKTDEKGNKISGALLQIIDSKGNVIKEFTSSEKAEELYGVLNELETYTLHEEKVPEGYLKAEDIKFKIDEEGKVNIYEGEEFKQQKENVIKMVDKKFENPKTTYKKIIVVFLLMMIVLTAMGILNKKTV